MMRIGIFGEHFDNDAQALKVLLVRKFNDEKKVIFIPIIKNLRGGQLDNINKLKRLLEAEIRNEKLDHVIAMRDLDSLPSKTEKIKLKEEWYRKLEMGDTGIFFLVIVEAEAIILADVETFNRKYSVNISNIGNPLLKENPKEFLRQHTSKSAKKYQESHALEIFKALNFERVYANHSGEISFQSFIDELDDIINPAT